MEKAITRSRFVTLVLLVSQSDRLTKIAKQLHNPERYFISGGLLYHLNERTGAVLCVPDVYDESGVNHRKRIFDEVLVANNRGHRGVNRIKLA